MKWMMRRRACRLHPSRIGGASTFLRIRFVVEVSDDGDLVRRPEGTPRKDELENDPDAWEEHYDEVIIWFRCNCFNRARSDIRVCAPNAMQ